MALTTTLYDRGDVQAGSMSWETHDIRRSRVAISPLDALGFDNHALRSMIEFAIRTSGYR